MDETKLTFSEAFTQLVRAVTRPIVTVIFVAVIADCVICGRTPPTWFLSLAIPTITWWFVERAVTHVVETKSSNGS